MGGGIWGLEREANVGVRFAAAALTPAGLPGITLDFPDLHQLNSWCRFVKPIGMDGTFFGARENIFPALDTAQIM